MSSFFIAQNGTTNYIASTKNNDTNYTFPSVAKGTYLMQGFNSNTYLDAFANSVNILISIIIDNTNCPLINNVII